MYIVNYQILKQYQLFEASSRLDPKVQPITHAGEFLKITNENFYCHNFEQIIFKPACYIFMSENKHFQMPCNKRKEQVT